MNFIQDSKSQKEECDWPDLGTITISQLGKGRAHLASTHWGRGNSQKANWAADWTKHNKCPPQWVRPGEFSSPYEGFRQGAKRILTVGRLVGFVFQMLTLTVPIGEWTGRDRS